MRAELGSADVHRGPSECPFAYDAFGLRLRSAFALPELPPAPDDERPADVVVYPGDAGAPVEGCGPRLFRVEGREAYLWWEHVGGFRVVDGREIVVGPDAADSPQLRLALLGVCAGVLLHQRGLLTLHASAVERDGDAVAFLGWKGAGKSTTAAALVRSGARLITDDVLVVVPGGEGPVAFPSFPQLKLRRDAADALGHASAPLLGTGGSKSSWTRGLPFQVGPLPLRALYLLASGDEVGVTRVDPSEAFLALLSQTYAPRFVGGAGRDALLFRQVVALTRSVPVYRLRRPYDLGAVDEAVDAVRRHVPRPRTGALVDAP